ncbi:MAG TPA: hypothetical protein VIU61_27870 [Kofleriaceae bacterium]
MSPLTTKRATTEIKPEPAFSEAEEAFFRAGDELAQAPPETED